MQSVIAYWDGQPRLSAELATDGWQYIPERGTARVFVASNEARARAKLHDERGADDALLRCEQARTVIQHDDEPGGYLSFTLATQARMAATTHLLRGGPANCAEAERCAGQAIELYEAAPPECRELGPVSIARIDLATAQLGRDDIDAASGAIADVIALAHQRPSAIVIHRLRQIMNALQRPRYQTTGVAQDLCDQIHTAIARPALSLPAGNT